MRPPIGTLLLLIGAVVLYAGTMGSLADAPHSDAAGRGMGLAFGALFATLLFVDIAVLLIVAAVKGKMSAVGKLGMVFLVPAAVVAIWMAADAYGAGDESALLVPAILPLVFVLYALRARFETVRGLMRERIADIVVVLVFAGLIGPPLLRAAFPPPRDLAAEAAETARQEREEKAAREAQEQAATKFAALGPQSSIADYLAFQYDRPGEVREGIRKVTSRQADAVALLKDGRLRDLASLLEWDVEATPELCAAYRVALGQEAAKIDPKVSTNYLGVAIDLEWQLPNLQWLTGEGCKLGPSLELLEKNLRANADSSRITKFADQIAALPR